MSVSTTCAFVAGANKKAQEVILDRVPYIHYPIQFQKEKEVIMALINSDSKVNTMTPAYTFKLGIQVWKTNVGAQKIDSSLLWTFGIVIAGF